MGLSAADRHGPWPASAARSARACRSACRPSQSASPHRHELPRGPQRAQPALLARLPHPDLHRGLTKGPRQLGDLGLEELRFPPADRLLGHLLLTCRLRDRDLTSQDRQHDPDLLLSRNHRRSGHRSQVPPTQTDPPLTGLPERMSHDSARQDWWDIGCYPRRRLTSGTCSDKRQCACLTGSEPQSTSTQGIPLAAPDARWRCAQTSKSGIILFERTFEV